MEPLSGPPGTSVRTGWIFSTEYSSGGVVVLYVAFITDVVLRHTAIGAIV